jgi:hypothetical protein
MVDYPIPKTGNVTGPIQTSLSPGEVAGPYSMLAHGLQKTGAALDDVASSLADQAGVKAVTTDANGNIQVDHAPIIGPAAEHYANAVKFGALAEGEGAVRRKDIELRTQFRDDPQGYLQASDVFAQKMQDQYTKAAGPLVGTALRKSIEPITTQTYRGLLNEKERLDLQRSVSAVDSQIEYSQNAMYAMARGGVTSGPEWDRAWDTVKTLTAQKVGNPRLAYPQEKATNDLNQLDTELRIQAGAHRIVDEQYGQAKDKEQGFTEAMKSAELIRTDPTLNMTPPQREAAYHRVVADLHARAMEDNRVIKAADAQINSFGDLAGKGLKPTDAAVGQLRQQVEAAGDPALKDKLEAVLQVGRTLSDMRVLPPAQIQQARDNLYRVMSGGGQTGAAGIVSQAETGDPTLGPRALGNISRDAGGTKSYGFTGLNSGSGSLAEFVGEHGARFGLRAPVGSVAFDAQWHAASTGQTEEFRNAQLKYFNEHNVASVRGSLSSLGIPEEVSKDPRVTAYFADRNVQMGTLGLHNAQSAWEHAHGDVPTFLRNMTSIDATPESLHGYFPTAIASGVYGPAGHATRLRTRLEGSLNAQEGVQGMMPAGATPANVALLNGMDSLLKEGRTQLAKDPIGWANRTGVMSLPPIMFGAPDAPAQMTHRVSGAEQLAQYYGTPVTYLTPDEKTALKDATAKGGPEMVGVVTTIAQGFGSRAPAVMKELSKDAPTLAHIGGLGISGGSESLMQDAAAGVHARTDPELKKTLPASDKTTMGAQNSRVRDVYGSAFAKMPEFSQGAQVTASDAWLARAARFGYDPTLGMGNAPVGTTSGNGKEVFDRTLQESAGATFIGDTQYGGIGNYTARPSRWSTYTDRVLVPHSVQADKFKNVIGAINEGELHSMGLGGQYRASDIQSATPVALPNGRYRFARGDVNSTSPKWVGNASGAPFELDFNQVEPQLRQRVPDAFLGR